MLRFALCHGLVHPALARASHQPRRAPANDTDDATASAAMTDDRVRAALRLFASHGLSAAERARHAAATARARGDDRGARWWTDIGHLLGERRQIVMR